MASFLVTLASGEQKLVSSEKNTLRVGRLVDCEIFLDEPVISRQHAEIYFDDNNFYVRDTGSRNGTLVNEELISRPTILLPGDIIEVGSAKIIYEQAESISFDAEQDLSEMTVIMSRPVAAPPAEGMAPLELLESVAEISKQIAQNRPLEGLLDDILSLCVDKLSAERAAILLIDENGELIPRAYFAKGRSHPKFVISRSIAQKAVEENRAILIEDVAHEEALKRKESVIGLQIRSAICHPMWNGERTIGALYLDTSEPSRQFGETDLLFFSTLSAMIAEKIDKAILWPWQVKIYTFGRFVLIKDEQPIVFTGKAQKKPLEMLKALIAFGGRDVSEERLVDALWPDAEGDLGHQAFNTTLHRLRKIIGKETILVHGSRVTLDSSRCWVDVWAFERLIGEAEPCWRSGEPEQHAQAAQLTEKAMAMNYAPFLQADTDKEWTIMLRERLRSKFLRNVSRLGDYLIEINETEKALENFQKGLEMDPLVEEFYRQAMLCQLHLGRVAEAKNTYRQCRKVLLFELGVEPSEKFKNVYRRLVSDSG